MGNNLQESLEIAEKKAKSRDFENSVDLSEVVLQEQKANELGYGLYKISNKNKASFVQLMDANLDVLLKSQYITFAEMGFVSFMSRYLSMQSNALKHPETDQFLTITDIAEITNRSRRSISEMVGNLINKGILYEIVSSVELKIHKRNVTSRPLYVNPEIMYKGDRNDIDPMLCDIVMEFDYIERNKVFLEWKVWHQHNAKSGKLYTRPTYLKYKKSKKKK